MDAEFHVIKILPLPRERINLGEHGFYLTNFKNVFEQEPMVDLTMFPFTDLPTLPSKIKKDLKDDIRNYLDRGEESFSESKVLKILRRLHLRELKQFFHSKGYDCTNLDTSTEVAGVLEIKKTIAVPHSVDSTGVSGSSEASTNEATYKVLIIQIYKKQTHLNIEKYRGDRCSRNLLWSVALRQCLFSKRG